MSTLKNLNKRFKQRDDLTASLAQDSRHRRSAMRGLSELELERDATGNDRQTELKVKYLGVDGLSVPRRNVREIKPDQVARVIASIREFGLLRPLLTTAQGEILDGVVIREAAKQLGLTSVPCIVTNHLSERDMRRLRIALNRLQETGSWNLPELAIELKELVIEFGSDFTIPGLPNDMIDQILLDDGSDTSPVLNSAPALQEQPVSRLGDIWALGAHRLGCGNAKDQDFILAIMAGLVARLCLTDPPYGVKIMGHVTNCRHRDFVEGGAGTTKQQLFELLRDAFRVIGYCLIDGGLCMAFMDWRGLKTMLEAADEVGLSLVNLIVWMKSNAGQGSLYRSRHEHCPLFKKGHAPHTNNIQLGRNGRWRSNVWEYPGASSLSSDARRGLELHPTTKPVEMLADAIRDVTDRGDIVLDPFLGSGSTLIAAHRTGRCFRGCELDPLYVDIALRRWIALSGDQPVLEANGQMFEEVSRERMEQAYSRS